MGIIRDLDWARGLEYATKVSMSNMSQRNAAMKKKQITLVAVAVDVDQQMSARSM